MRKKEPKARLTVKQRLDIAQQIAYDRGYRAGALVGEESTRETLKKQLDERRVAENALLTAYANVFEAVARSASVLFDGSLGR